MNLKIVNHYVIYLKLLWYCKSIIPQFKNKKEKKKKGSLITPQLVLPSEGLLPFVTRRGHSPSLRHWLAASDEGGGRACRMRGSHAAEGIFSRERKLGALQPSSRASAEPDYTRMNGDQ